MPIAKLVCLLPVRNGAADLPGYFASARRFADAIVALDDGSTDDTRALLAAESLVKIVLSNPPRTDYRDWDDAGNRNRLLAAAASLEPEWILSLDADERIDADDAAALRAFVDQEAIPDCAYGFRVYRMVETSNRYDRADLWVYRLFAHEPGQRFPERRLHFVPVPTSIPRRRWLRTTVRIQHLASLTEERRRARFAKYREADPNNAMQSSYDHLLDAPEDVKQWPPRPPGQPILDAPLAWGAAARADAVQPPLATIVDRPALSAIIIARDEEAGIARSVASVVSQDCPWPFEVIVVVSGTDRTAHIVREQFPDVTLVELPRPALPGEARNAGLRLARGDYVSFPGAHVELIQGSLAARLRAHELGYAMVTGTTLIGTRTRSGWASYFLDHSAVLPGRPSGAITGAPGSCSYRREALLAVGGFPENLRAGEDTVVNQELIARGYLAYRAHNVRLIHHSPCRTPWRLVRHHFTRGRGLMRIQRGQYADRRAFLRGPSASSTLYRGFFRRLAQVTRNVASLSDDPEFIAEFCLSFPLVVAGAFAALVGAWYELLRPAIDDIDSVRLRRSDQEIRFSLPTTSPATPRTEDGSLAGQGEGPDDRVAILMYHHLDVPGTDWSVTTDQLNQQMAWLRNQGYVSVNVSQLADAIGEREALPARAVVITNDDGHAETLRFAEILNRHGFTGTYYLPNAMALSPDEIRALERLGNEIGGHTVSHRNLAHLDADEQRAEITENKAFLESIVGHPIRSFAYPNGGYDRDTACILAEAGYDNAVEVRGGPVRVLEHGNLFHLRRVQVLGTTTLEQFTTHFGNDRANRALPSLAVGWFGGPRHGQLLPWHRILAYYGYPGTPELGILGEHEMADLLAKLEVQAAAFEAADSTRPVKLAFELIATTAARAPGPDGMYRRRTSAAAIERYATFTAAHDVQLILDLQIGLSPLADEIAAVWPWLELPHVHLALDPEWAMGEGQTPGLQLGSLNAAAITIVQETLAELVADRNLPPKLLLVHQFNPKMIPEKARLASIPGVQLVIDSDGFGSPTDKTRAYRRLVRNQPVEYAGIKLFFKQDRPLMTPDQVLTIEPAPDVVIYQ